MFKAFKVFYWVVVYVVSFIAGYAIGIGAQKLIEKVEERRSR